ncbi:MULTISPECIES: hypothetical protein [Sulfurimonas]|uniref:hypothetical protein n=1 Tax=Sulfurimonas TaxID=202746 RepID=UPI0012642D71|nr:hypothetical protein [Sulfurimonas indica]
MTKQMNPMLREENRQKLIEEAMQAISDKQAQVIKQADKIIGNVAMFEANVHKKFMSSFAKQ